MVKDDKQEPWYKDGLRFKCTGCGQCCTGSPGHVWIDQEEIAQMAQFLNISPEEFIKKYTRRVKVRLSLTEDPKNFVCIFLKEKKCLIYQSRPYQCRAFPWWIENLRSEEEWQEAKTRCEGIDHPDAPLITLGEIHSVIKGK